MYYFYVEAGVLQPPLQNGEYWVFSMFFILLFLFIGFMYFYYFIAKKIYKKYSNNIFDIQKIVYV
jgi:hypothetical protein